MAVNVSFGSLLDFAAPDVPAVEFEGRVTASARLGS
jgi:hypothetical protein